LQIFAFIPDEGAYYSPDAPWMNKCVLKNNFNYAAGERSFIAVFIDINGHKWPCTGGVNAALPANVDSGDSLFKMGRMRKFAMHPFEGAGIARYSQSTF